MITNEEKPSPVPSPAASTRKSSAKPRLKDRLPAAPIDDVDEILDRFLSWVADYGFELYPAQEEALLEIMAGRHVVLNTPTGSGKSLVALGMHFKAMCEGKRSFYTSPIKALASEKFFDLCDNLGADNVGMKTGDANINSSAMVVCCTAEVLSNMALRQGAEVGAAYVVMDEFHYYADPDRGVAWQVPLLTLPDTRFLLMSATLGNTRPITERMERQGGIEVAHVYSDERPVPLEFDYRETPLHRTVEELLEADRAPIYIVNFTQRECAELAQALTCGQVASKEVRRAIAQQIAGFRFDTPYGKEFRRFLSFGVGVHHAGLLPKYRLLVEQLAQQGLMRVICGTDTLGVGVNIPIRTVLFTKLAKYDGRKVSLLKVRDFKQIAGRAGRRGFDDHGWVVCQAPEQVIRDRKAAAKGKKKKKSKPAGRRPGRPGEKEVSWNEQTFRRLIDRPPETLKSRFKLSHGMLLNLLQHDAELNDPGAGNFSTLRQILRDCHEDDQSKQRLLQEAAVLVRSLYRSGVIKMARDTDSNYLWAVVNEDLQWDFSLFQVLSLFLVETLEDLDKESETYALDVVSLVESILEDPRIILRRQVDKLRGDLVARLKAQGVPYEERMEKLDEVIYPMPNAAEIDTAFDTFRRAHPWVRGADVSPKGIARDLYERYASFQDYVRLYGLQRSEGVLVRYLSQFYKTLSQSVPERSQTAEVYDVLAYFRTMIERIDTSLLEEWQSLLHPELALEKPEKSEQARRDLWLYELLHDNRAFTSRVRAELHELVRCLSQGEWSAATGCVIDDPEAAEYRWDEERFENAMEPFFEQYGKLKFDHAARQTQHTRVEKTGPRSWQVSQVLIDPEGDHLWYLGGSVDLHAEREADGPLVRLEHLGV